MIKNKKSQFLVLSMTFLVILMIFFYYQETQNNYILKSDNSLLLKNIIFETCKIGKISNGSFIDNRYANFSIFVKNYCNNFNANCNLSIINNTAIPPFGNWSKLNYTNYNYYINYSFKGYIYSGEFNC